MTTLSLPTNDRFLQQVNNGLAKQNIALTDIKAIQIWASTKRGSDHTRRAYIHEAQRFLAWLIEYYQGPFKETWLDSVTSEDAQQYIYFLENEKLPFKQSTLDAAGLGSQPFVITKLSKILGQGADCKQEEVPARLEKPSSQRAISALKAMYKNMQTLVLPGIKITQNPFYNHKLSQISRSKPLDLALTDLERTYVEKALDRMRINETPKKYHQLRWIWKALINSALRRSELANATTRWLKQDKLGTWILSVEGKGGTSEDIPLNAIFIDEFKIYRESLGLSPLPNLTKNGVVEALVHHIRNSPANSTNVSDKLIYRAIKDIFSVAASLAEDDKNDTAKDRLNSFATHSTRHTCVTCIVDETGDITLGRDMARHKSIVSTQGYKAKNHERLLAVMNELEL